MSASFSIDTLRVMLHVLGVTVWLGGQIVMMALLPVLRSAGVENLPATAARAFQRVAWPGFALAVATGIWNLLAVDMSLAETSWHMVFGIKFLLVVVSGGAAALHANTSKPSLRAATGAIGFLSALIAFILGFAMSH